MSIFRRPHYSSEITNFIEEMKEKKPTLEAEQRAGRALLWDKNLDRGLLEEYGEAPCRSSPTCTRPKSSKGAELAFHARPHCAGSY